MFAPKMAKAQTNTARPSGNAIDRPRMRGTTGNQAALRHLRIAAIQPKLTIGQVNDPLEHEADHIADRVMRMPDPAPAATAAPVNVARKCAACEESETPTIRPKSATPALAGQAPAIVGDVLNTRGQPLDARARNFLEPRFNRGFESVRIHTDQIANQSAERIGALAYTAGHHIAFAAGRYAPASPDGLKLIAHELAHVAQQEGAGPQVQRQPQPQPQAQTQPMQQKDYRDFVQSTIDFLNGSAEHFGDPLMKIDQALFEKLMNDWYGMVTDREQMITTQLNGDKTLTDALHAAYLKALHVLIGKAVKLLGKTEAELYETNSGRIPLWAWQAPHRMEPGISTPLAENQAADPLSGNVLSSSNGFDVSILPDKTDDTITSSAETNAHVTIPGIPAFEYSTSGKNAPHIITKFDPVSRPKVEIQTSYRPGVSAQSTSGYGRGTTPEDVAGGKADPRSTQLGFHEGNHGLAFQEFIAANPAPVFTGAVGMTEAAYKAAGDKFKADWKAYIARLNEYSIKKVDCVGLTKEQYEQANPPQGGATFHCPH